MTEIIVAAITGGLALAGVIITNVVSNRKNFQHVSSEIKTTQAVTNTKIEELTREVREHNDFAKRVPVIEEQIKVINHRIEDLEEKKK